MRKLCHGPGGSDQPALDFTRAAVPVAGVEGLQFLADGGLDQRVPLDLYFSVGLPIGGEHLFREVKIDGAPAVRARREFSFPARLDRRLARARSRPETS